MLFRGIFASIKKWSSKHRNMNQQSSRGNAVHNPVVRKSLSNTEWILSGFVLWPTFIFPSRCQENLSFSINRANKLNIHLGKVTASESKKVKMSWSFYSHPALPCSVFHCFIPVFANSKSKISVQFMPNFYACWLLLCKRYYAKTKKWQNIGKCSGI